jgi:hypothetical protein
MKKVRFLFAFVVIATFLLTACGGQAQAAEPAPIVEPPTADEPAPSAPTSTQAEAVEAEPVESVAPTQSQYAPFCETGAANGCETPAITMIDPKYCVDKVPYVIISVPPGTTYKSSDLDMECNQEMHNDGNLRIACHSLSGKDSWSYDLELCNGACTAPALQTETGQCPEGYGYDPANSCCAAPAPASSNGCTTFTVDLRVCYGE